MAQVNITFEVNTAAMSSVDAAGIFVAGGLGFGIPGDNPLTDPDGDGIFTATISKPVGFSSHYAFLNGNCPDWSCKENLGGLPCADANNYNDRWLPPVMSDTTIMACYGTCDNDGTCTLVTDSVTVTFQLNTSSVTPEPGGFFVGGGSGFGGPTDNMMTDPDMDGNYTITFTRAVGFSSHYTFLNGDCGWDCKENIGGLVCADPNNFNDRWLPAVMSDTTILACFGNCADDGTCDVILMPNLPMNFEDAGITYAPAGFGAATSAIIANPNIDADNGSAMVWNVTKPTGSQSWAGASIDLEAPMDFSLTSTINLKFYSDFAGIPVNVKIENADASSTAEVLLNTTVNGGWETMSFDLSTSTNGVFDASIDYTKFVVFPDFNNVPFLNAIPFYFDDVELDVIPVLPNLPLDFEDGALLWNFQNFGGVETAERIANPDMNVNTSATVLHTNKVAGAEVWGGTFQDLASPIDFSGTTNLTLDVWAPNVSDTILIKLEGTDAGGGATSCEVKGITTVANGWHTLTYDMASSTTGTFDLAASYTRVVIFPDFGKVGPVDSIDHYFDNLQLGVADRPIVPTDFESNGLAWDLFGFGGVNTVERIANPDMNVNTSATVLHLNKSEGAEVWGGAGYPLSAPIDFSSNTTLGMHVWAPNVGDTILLKLEELDGGGAVVSSAEIKTVTTVASGWHNLIFDMTADPNFNAATNYNQVIIFPAFGTVGATGGADYYFDNLDFYTAPIILPTLPIDFESTTITYQNTAFGNASSSVLANPGPAGINTSATVFSIEKPAGAEVWAGSFIPLASPIDFTTATAEGLSVKVWSPKAGATIRLKIEDTADPTVVFAEMDAVTTVANEWHTLFFNMSQAPTYDMNASYNQVVLFPDFGVAGAGETYYFDDIMNDDIMDAISESDLSKVNVKAFPNPTDSELNLQFSIPVSGQITVTVVDVLGRNVQFADFGKLNEGNHQEAIDFTKMVSGNYFMIMRLDGQIISTKT